MSFADEGDAHALDAADELLNGQQIGESLERVIGRREHVQHRHRFHSRHLLDQTVLEHARGDDRVIAGERASHVLDALARADAELGRLQIDRMAAELCGRHFHRVARPRARLLEIERNALVLKHARRGALRQLQDRAQIIGS